jgi:hypothetical protein
MTVIVNEVPQTSPFRITQLLVEKKYTPNPDELIETLKGLDLVEQFKDTVLVDEKNVTLSFDTQDHAHLFALALGAQGHSRNLFVLTLSDGFFEEDLLDDYRPDGLVLSLSENKKNDRNEISVVLKQGKEDYRVELSELVKEFVSSSIPHLADKVNYLSF